MSGPLSKVTQRLSQTAAFITGRVQDPNSVPWNPDNLSFPLRKDLPKSPGQPDDTAWVWGQDDYVGRLNLLTPTRVRAAAGEIRTGETAPLDLPLNVPAQPGFGREVFEHEIKELMPGIAYDDVYKMNTQSSTQWDGFRHCAHVPSKTFYNNSKSADFIGPSANDKASIHHWREHGFCGRAVFLDYRSYANGQGLKYDTASHHSFSYDELEACGRHQGLDIRPASQGGDIQIGDILLIRFGWTEDYYSRTAEENKSIGLRETQTWAGVKQEQRMIDWLHDCYFAAIGSDVPAFEVWPTKEKYHLHEYILALWGMPLGEMIDLEGVAKLAKKNNRWSFFLTSAPFRTPGGVSTAVNGTAIF